ncbi:hypothetical protein PENTCL1PPCAC_7056 [Pristionchus entomophagus]|uniref:C2H2-type domain-containing protein n=1 Tax=Pristionchus entomophagus TaxID=358040 RepID=A0AAV5SND1_9BILA|nr:hypothetical protein PENTCL1PPCAC_7056 [Pristionchus entomophagus]
MDVLKSDAFLYLAKLDKDPQLPCGKSPSNDSLLAFRDSQSSRIKVEIKEEVDDWEGPNEEDITHSYIDNTLGNAEIDIGPSASWNEFYQSLREESSIQEIIVPENNDPIEPVLHENNGERKKYQRFREKKFVCDECDRCFTLKQNVQQHVMIYHMNGAKQLQVKRGKRFKCLKCGQVFKTLEQARKHDVAKHGVKTSGIRVFKCEQCPKVYPTSSALKEHVMIFHLKERPFECAECGIRFGRKGGLRRHMQMVHENQLYMCPFEGCKHPGYKCTKVHPLLSLFSILKHSFEALAAHIRSVHTNDRPFRCMLCDRTFVRKNDLKTHEMTHQATATLICQSCNKAFKRLAGLRAHKKRCKLAKKEEEEEKEIKKEIEKKEEEVD